MSNDWEIEGAVKKGIGKIQEGLGQLGHKAERETTDTDDI